MRYFFVFTFLLSGLLVWGQRKNPVILEFEAEKLYYQGRERYHRGEFNQAINYFNQVLQTNPDHPEVYELRGEAYFQLKNYGQAIRDYQAAIKRDPNNADLYNSAGVAAAQLEQCGVAIAYFEQALVVDPSYEDAQLNLAAAEECYEVGVSDGPKPEDDPFEVDNLAPKMSFVELDAWRIGARSPMAGTRGNETVRSERDFSRTSSYTYDARRGKVNVGAQSDPQVRIVRVITSKKETEVSLIITNVTNESYPVVLARRGDHAFFLADPNLNKYYRLKQVVGLRSSGDTYTFELSPNQDLPFSLRFEPIDADLHTFHLLEGRTPRAGAWNFWNITLKD